MEKVKFEDGKWQFDKAMANDASWDREIFDLIVAETVKNFDGPETNEFWKQYNIWERMNNQ